MGELKADMGQLRTDMAQFRNDMGNDMLTLKAEQVEFRSLIREDLSKIRDVNGDTKQIVGAFALQVGAMLSKLMFVIVGTVIGVAGIVLAAVKL
jgi:hypothetical protein